MTNKKEFCASKQAITLRLVDTDKIVVSDKTKYIDNGSKYFIGYLDDDDNIIRSLCIILPQMIGYMKYFDDGGKNMYFKIKNEDIYLENNEIWNKIKKAVSIRFHSLNIYDDKYIKTKVKIFDGVINTVFSDNKIPKEKRHYICIPAISIDSILKIDLEKLSSRLSGTM